MTDYIELVNAMQHCATAHECKGCPREGVCDTHGLPRNKSLLNEIGKALGELMGFAYSIAELAIKEEYDEISTEVLLRKLNRIGIVRSENGYWIYDFDRKE